MSPSFAPRHILVPIDFEDPSRHAQELARMLAQKFEARITLLHVWTVPAPVYAGAFTWPIDGVETAARARLARELEDFKATYPKSDALLAAGFAPDTILATAKAEGVDLIVMGSHGRTGLQHVLLGSVAERVLRRAPMPVLTTR